SRWTAGSTSPLRRGARCRSLRWRRHRHPRPPADGRASPPARATGLSFRPTTSPLLLAPTPRHLRLVTHGPEAFLSAFKSEQRHLIVRGRAFHFVSYEGRPANAHRGEDQQPPMWYLMVEGRRFAAFPCDAHQAGAE